MFKGNVAAAPFVGDDFASLYVGATRVPTVPGKPVVSSAVYGNDFVLVTFSYADGGASPQVTYYFDGEPVNPTSDEATLATFDDAEQLLGSEFTMKVSNAVGESPLSDPVTVVPV
jgi:hypothetical protein